MKPCHILPLRIIFPNVIFCSSALVLPMAFFFSKYRIAFLAKSVSLRKGSQKPCTLILPEFFLRFFFQVLFSEFK